jgi:hypothetical protein
MYFAFDVRGGKGGEQGLPGEPGLPGKFGAPGKGGSGGKKQRDSKGSDGTFGFVGKPGKIGDPGKRGLAQCSGKNGKNGRIFFKVTETEEIGATFFSPKIIDYTMKGMENGGVYSSKEKTVKGIFSPGEEIVIEDLTIQNIGDLTLPKGLVIDLQENESFALIKGEKYIIQESIKPGEIYKTSFKISAYFKETISPNHPGIYKNTVEIFFKCKLLNRTILHSERKDKIEIKYPIQIHKLVSPSVMTPGESKEFQIDFKNIGEKNKKVGYRIALLDNEFSFEDGSNSFSGSEMKEPKITHSYSRVKLNIESMYFKKLNWKVELYLNEKLIQFEQKEVRVCPKFNLDTVSTDLLMITNPSLSSDEYKIYMKVFSSLQLVPNFYDLEMYKDEKSSLWEKKYRGKIIIFPLFGKESINALQEKDILSHFVLNIGETYDELDSGLIILGNYTYQLLIDNLFSLKDIKQYEIPESEFSDTFYVNTPTKEDMNIKIKKIEELKSEEFPSQICQVRPKEFSPKSLGYFSYSYGKAYVKKLPLSRLHKFITIFKEDTKTTIENYSNSFFTSDTVIETKSTFRTESHYFQFLLAVVSTLSMEMKLKLLMNGKLSLKFIHGDYDFDIVQLIQNSLYDDIKREFFFRDQGLRRVEKLMKFYENDLDFYSTEVGIFTIWFLLSRLESNTFWRSIPFLSSFNEKRSKLSQAKEKFWKFLESKLKLKLPDLSSIKEKAEKSSVDPQRLKWNDISHCCQYPFVDLK